VTVLVTNGVWKSYPSWQPGTRSLRSMLSPRLRGTRRAEQVRWALRDVSVALDAGGTLGVIGHNGAGKSTLLRLASGLGTPTRGSIWVAPTTASVLSLGATFNGDLSGASNAITAAVIGGMTRTEARDALPRAIAFAGLEGFEDAPVRSYSDGMMLRLAFGVLTLTRPDLLILDEVLAVGDLRFQQKCVDHLHDVRERGTAIVLASHDLGQIAEECDRVVLLERGRVRAFGDPETVIEEYEHAVETETIRLTPGASSTDDGLVLHENRFGSQEHQIEQVVVGASGHRAHVEFGRRLEVTVTIAAAAQTERVILSVAVERERDSIRCMDLNTELDEVSVRVGLQPVVVTLILDALELRPGRYWVDVGMFPLDWRHAYDYHHHVYPLTVTGASDDSQAIYRPQNRRWALRSQ
jgi:lipopolysaccharide transport system ATP-binding protein